MLFSKYVTDICNTVKTNICNIFDPRINCRTLKNYSLYFLCLLSVFCFVKTVEDSLICGLSFIVCISQKSKNSCLLYISPTKTYPWYINVQMIRISSQTYMYPKNKPQ